MSDLCSGQLKLYSNIPETEVDWLWYPYIPFGKLSVLNGDPGNGKSTLMMNIIAAASSGGFVPDGRKMKKPIHVIYQCSEDSAGDTIKPRLIAAGADCSNVAFLFKLTDFELFVNGKKSKSYLPGEWRDYFGTPVEQHEESYKINLADGYITTDKT